VDLVHQLPVTRMDLLIGRGLVAYLSVWIPLMVTGLVVYALRGLTPQFSNILQWKYLLGWMVHGSIFLLLHTAIVIFMGFVTGMIPTHGLFAIIAYLFPLGIYILTFGNMSLLVETYEFSFDVSRRFSWWLPIMRISLEEGFPYVQDLVYLIVGILIFLGAYLLYRIRDLEMAGSVIAFEKLNRIFKYGMGFSFMLCGGPFFYALSNDSLTWLYAGYALGGLFGFFVAEVLVRKSFHVLRHWKGFLVFAGACILFIAGLRMDIIGIKNWQPKAEHIERLHLSGMSWYYYNKEEDPAPISLSLKEKTLALQEEMIAANLPEDTPDTDMVYLYYYLGHGGQSRRSYTLDDHFLNTSYRAYLADPEVKEMNFPILTADMKQIADMTLSSSLMPGRQITISDKAEIAILVDALRADIKGLQSDSYLDFQPYNGERTLAHVEFLDQDGNRIFDMPLKRGYDKTLAQLAASGRLDRLTLKAEDVDSMSIQRLGTDREDRMIVDRQAIEDMVELINEHGDRGWLDEGYEVILFFEDRSLNNLYHCISVDELPASLAK
jgi:ABC-2 type transport system permease protein